MMVSSNNNNHSLGRWSNMVQRLLREHGSEGDNYLSFTLMPIQRGRGSSPPVPAASSSAINVVYYQTVNAPNCFTFVII
ncbi:hypothetical protein C4D60_Mb04t16280 [Musa balbisiana]|uniref:Uncharacterized protein n=1 Tax=Musa balbisiana TaxID=52838 RepID=A0A4S8KCF4_MUSBA|nr:hypothetical protein C4D60_Mb04t16280 [Musa balbisiana]